MPTVELKNAWEEQTEPYKYEHRPHAKTFLAKMKRCLEKYFKKKVTTRMVRRWVRTSLSASKVKA